MRSVSRSAAGNPRTREALHLLITRGDLLEHARSLLRGMPPTLDEEDLLQDTYLTLLRLRRRGGRRPALDVAEFLTHARAVLGNVVRNARRSELRRRRSLGGAFSEAPHPGEVFSLAASGASPPAALLARESQWRVRRAVEKLRRPHRHALNLVYLHDTPLWLAASILGITRSALQKRLSAGLKALRVHLYPLGDGR